MANKNLVVSYDSIAKKFKFVDPDQVLLSSANSNGQTNPNGLPKEFVDKLESEIDVTIEGKVIDGGTY
jgi:hypothetical protein